MKPKPWLVAVLVGAVLGFVFAALSTYDFVQHLDRQVHALHCSFIPGAGSELGESGCQVAMMSEYSSVFRSKVWGGIPISLPAMAVFGFIACFAIDLLLSRRQHDPRATAFLALATGLPAAASLTMLVISLTQLGTTCKLCVAIYVASALCLVGAIVTWRRATAAAASGDAPHASRAPHTSRASRASSASNASNPRAPARDARLAEPHPDEPAWASGAPVTPRVLDEEPGEGRFAGDRPPRDRDGDSGTRSERRTSIRGDSTRVSHGYLGAAFGIGVAFVVVPVVAYLAFAPDHGRFVGTCDVLPKPADTYNIMVPVERTTGGVPSIEILDPLCPACRAFESRLAGSGLATKLDRKAVLFPLDNTCNWMVTEATHPGACSISEAVLCAGDRAPDVIAWAFAEQERIRTETKADPAAAARIAKERFPELAACVGSAEARSRLNKSLRWAVANNIRVLTPQLFVDNVKLCDEDVDLGLEYALGIMLERRAAGTLAPAGTPTTAKPVEAMPHGSASDAKPTDAKSHDSKSDNSKSTPDASKPTPDNAKSTPDTSKPTPDSAKSTPDSAKSTPDSAKSTLDSAKSTPDSSKPTDSSTPTPPSGPVTTPPVDDSKPAEPKSAEPRPAEPKPAEPKPAEPKPAEPKPAEPAPAGGGS